MLIATGLMITWVLIVLVGQTVQVMEKVGWLPVTPIEGLHLPYWSGVWFGLYPTWEGILAQTAAATFVIGSYLAAEHLRRRKRQTHSQQAEPPTPRGTATRTTSWSEHTQCSTRENVLTLSDVGPDQGT